MSKKNEHCLPTEIPKSTAIALEKGFESAVSWPAANLTATGSTERLTPSWIFFFFTYSLYILLSLPLGHPPPTILPPFPSLWVGGGPLGYPPSPAPWYFKSLLPKILPLQLQWCLRDGWCPHKTQNNQQGPALRWKHMLWGRQLICLEVPGWEEGCRALTLTLTAWETTSAG